MGFACECDDCWSFYRSDFVTARKTHRCCECLRIIEPGEEYQNEFGIWEGEPSTLKTCEECAGLRASYNALGYCHTYGELWADHYEELSGRGVSEDHPAMIKARSMLAKILERDPALRSPKQDGERT